MCSIYIYKYNIGILEFQGFFWKKLKSFKRSIWIVIKQILIRTKLFNKRGIHYAQT